MKMEIGMPVAGDLECLWAEIDTHTVARLDRSEQVTHATTDFKDTRTGRDKKRVVPPQKRMVKALLLGWTQPRTIVVKCFAVEHLSYNLHEMPGLVRVVLSFNSPGSHFLLTERLTGML